jgi:hypothetical protein
MNRSCHWTDCPHGADCVHAKESDMSHKQGNTPRTDALLVQAHQAGMRVKDLGPLVALCRELEICLSDGSRWIPVSERLPDEGTRVIGVVPDLFSRGITVVQREGRVSDPSVVLWTYEAEWVGEEGSRSYVDVTHWMPLPEAPK